MSAPPAPARRARLRRLGLGLAVCAATLALLEGLSSLALFAWDVAVNAEAPFPERRHTSYDPELGWVNEKSLRAEDLYGPGRSFTSNALGVRGSVEYAQAVPEGKRRIVCSGDSFTLGYGVDDEHAWPRRMELDDPALEAVNMGQGGYGLDQAYLWYRRDGANLACDAHLFAFIPHDFERMRSKSFQGYRKPVLALDGEGLEVAGTPVPRGSLRFPWLTQNAKLFTRLRSLELLTRAQRTLAPQEASEEMPEDVAEEVARRIFADLARIDGAKGCRLALVHLPQKDHRAGGGVVRLERWMQRAVDAARAQGLSWIDLAGDFEALDEGSFARMFLPKGLIALPGAAGHYSEEGNAFVARRLREELDRLGLLP